VTERNTAGKGTARVLTLHAYKDDRIVVIKCTGRIDGTSAPDLDRECSAWIVRGEKTIVLDLSAVQYISSAGLGSVLSAGKQLDRSHGRLALSGLKGSVEDVFRMAGLDAIFRVFENLESALEGIRKVRGAF
jgi:anti-sigma B factor antagonist